MKLEQQQQPKKKDDDDDNKYNYGKTEKPKKKCYMFSMCKWSMCETFTTMERPKKKKC